MSFWAFFGSAILVIGIVAALLIFGIQGGKMLWMWLQVKVRAYALKNNLKDMY